MPVAPFANSLPVLQPNVTVTEFLSVFHPTLYHQLDDGSSSQVVVLKCPWCHHNEPIDIADILLETITLTNIEAAAPSFSRWTTSYCPSFALLAKAEIQAIRPTVPGKTYKDAIQRIKDLKKEILISSILCENYWRLRELLFLITDPSILRRLCPEETANILAVIQDYDKGRVSTERNHFYLYALGQRWGGPYPQAELEERTRSLKKDKNLGPIWVELTNGFQSFNDSNNRLPKPSLEERAAEKDKWETDQKAVSEDLQQWWKEWIRTDEGKEHLRSEKATPPTTIPLRTPFSEAGSHDPSSGADSLGDRAMLLEDFLATKTGWERELAIADARRNFEAVLYIK